MSRPAPTLPARTADRQPSYLTAGARVPPSLRHRPRRSTAIRLLIGVSLSLLLGASVHHAAAVIDPAISPGQVTTFAGSGTAQATDGTGTGASFDGLGGLAVSGGTGYVSSNGSIRRVNLSTSAVTTLTGTGVRDTSPCFTDSANPGQVTFNRSSDLTTDGTAVFSLASCYGNYSYVRRTVIATGATSTLAQVVDASLQHITYAPDGYLYVTGYVAGDSTRIRRIDPSTGAVTVFATDTGTTGLNAITADAQALWVVGGLTCGPGPCGHRTRLDRVDLATAAITTVASEGPNNFYGAADGPLEEALVSAGNYLFSGARGQVRRYAKADGSWVTVAGTTELGYADGTGTDAWFSGVHGLGFDGSALWVADDTNNRLRKVVAAAPLAGSQSPTATTTVNASLGSVTTLAGNGTAATVDGTGAAASFPELGGMQVVGGYGYVSTETAIRKVNLATGQVATLAGSAVRDTSSGCPRDNADPSQVRFRYAGALATDGHYLYSTTECYIVGYGAIRRTSLATGATSTVGYLAATPRYLTLGPDGYLYATDGSTTISRIDPVTGAVSAFTTDPGATTLNAIAADANALWVVAGIPCGSVCSANTRLDRVDLASRAVTTIVSDPPDNTDPQVSFAPDGGTLVSAGDFLYAGDRGTIRRYAKADGAMVSIAGTYSTCCDAYADGIGTGAAMALQLRGLASDGTNLYFADARNYRLRQVIAVPPVLAAGGPVLRYETAGGTCNPTEITGCAQRQVGRPVNTATGAEFDTTTDLAVPGRGPALSLSRTYDSQLAGINGRFGYGWTDSYAMSVAPDPDRGAAPLATSPVVVVTQEGGARTAFARNADGSYSAASRVLASLTRNGDGSYTFLRRARARFDFDATGRLTREVDLNGYSTTLAYNTAGQLVTVTEPAGRQLSFGYGADGHVSAVTDPSRTVSYGYDTAGNLTRVTDARGGVSTLGYDGAHRLTTMTDQRGKTTTNAYDDVGRVSTQTDPMNRITRFAYSPPSGLGSLSTTITDPKGNVSVHRYANGLLASETKGYGSTKEATWTYTYDPVTDGLASVTDPNGHTDSFSYDAAGNRVTATDGLGHTTTSTYDGLNDLRTVTDPNGVTTTLTYDSAGNLRTTSTPLAGTSQVRTTTLAYGDAAHPGDVTTVTDPNGKVWSYAYNARGDLRRSTDPLGNVTTATYNTIGQPISSVSPRGNATGGTPASFTTSYAWNSFGQLTSSTDPLGHVTSYGYDAVGNVTSVTDAAGRVTRTTYDGDNEPTTVTRPDLSTLGYGYDGNGNQVRQTDGAGRDTTYGYDPLNRLASMTDPLGRRTTYGYDGAGNQTRVTDAAGHVTTLAYDAADRLGGVNNADPATPDVTYGYDNADRRTAMTDGTGSSSYAYDSLDRLTRATDGAGATVSYGYDLAGQLTTLTYPGTTGTVARAFDDAGRLTRVTDWASRSSTFGYDPDGNLTSIGYPNGTSATLAYDNADQLTTMAHARAGTTLASFGYARTAAGQVSGLTTTGTPQSSESYGYNPLDQLTTVNGGSYGYDAADNLTTLANGSTLTYDLANQLTALTSPTGPATSYGFDARGNRTSATVSGGPTTTYGYDADNRLVSLSGTGVPTPASYTYNGDGLRMSKTVGTATSRFSWDLAAGLPLALTDSTNTYVYGPGGLPIEQVSSSGTATYLHADQLGSVRLMTDAAGMVVGTRAYDSYGAPAGSTGTAVTPFGYTGEYTDAESGLLYLRARYYDPVTGQFLTRDPLAALTQSPYGYVGGDPLNASDPSGLVSCPFGRNANGSCRGGRGYVWGVTHLNPMYPVVGYYAQEVDAYQSGCGYWRSAKYGLKGTAVAAGQVLAGYGAGKAGSWALRKLLMGRAGSAGAAAVTSLGSTGRTEAANLAEQLAMEQAMSNPSGGVRLPIVMSDPSWPASDGWVKMSQNINGIEIHYVRNWITGAADDFKLVG